MFRFGFVTISILAGAVWCQNFPENPCTNVFSYRQQRGVYYGEINIPYDGSKDLNLAVNISMQGLYQSAKLRIDLLTPAESILSSPVLTYRVNFPFANVIPRITQITFNGRIFCYGPSEPSKTLVVT
ncbi:hypothetical protein BDFB_011675 [Asbolus verrucosus]|uniref:Serine protease gd N-terminal domain-containing protein n=1 Tax=Asbolus verrucosus TaxID=1661398 RepID=A0A482VS36_ASBVE|nr:hypothetical protein BDFB_011675 [Asbolus verrucosus]